MLVAECKKKEATKMHDLSELQNLEVVNKKTKTSKSEVGKNVVEEIGILKTIDEANIILAKIAVCKRNIAFVETALAEECANLRLEAERRTSCDKVMLSKLEEVLRTFALSHKDSLFKYKKHIALSFGSFGFRESARLTPIEGWSWEGVMAALENSGMTAFIKSRKDIDKIALKTLPKKTLLHLGCESQVFENFVYTI